MKKKNVNINKMPPKPKLRFVCTDEPNLKQGIIRDKAGRCFKKGLRAGFAAGLQKGRRQGVQQGKVNEGIRQGVNLAPVNNVYVNFDQAPEPMDEPPAPEQPAPANIKVSSTMLKNVLGKERYKQFVNAKRARMAELGLKKTSKEVYRDFGIPELKILAEYLLEVVDGDNESVITLNNVIRDTKVQGNKGNLKRQIESVIAKLI